MRNKDPLAMPYRKPLIALGLIAVLVIGAAGPAAAHDWTITVQQGEMELGAMTSPSQPVAGMTTEFSARIKDTGSYEGEANRTSWGGITNKAVEVHIHGPDGLHDHVEVHVPEDEAHFHWSYQFPKKGTYSFTVVTTIEGQEYAFEFQKEVGLLPAKATGEEMKQVSSDVQAVNEQVNANGEQLTQVNEEVEALKQQVQDLKSQNDKLQSQLNSLQQQLEEQSSHEDTETSQSQAPGFGIGVAVAAIAVLAAFLIGRRV